jgi:hypothetical protein
VNLKELKIAVDAANEYAGDTDAEVFVVVGKRGEYKIANIMQGGVIPAVYITVGEKVYDACK